MDLQELGRPYWLELWQQVVVPMVEEYVSAAF